eukprot:1676478-Rhodomonas_salina.3
MISKQLGRCGTLLECGDEPNQDNSEIHTLTETMQRRRACEWKPGMRRSRSSSRLGLASCYGSSRSSRRRVSTHPSCKPLALCMSQVRRLHVCSATQRAAARHSPASSVSGSLSGRLTVLAQRLEMRSRSSGSLVTRVTLSGNP